LLHPIGSILCQNFHPATSFFPLTAFFSNLLENLPNSHPLLPILIFQAKRYNKNGPKDGLKKLESSTYPNGIEYRFAAPWVEIL
jgi:hypothetical protein